MHNARSSLRKLAVLLALLITDIDFVRADYTLDDSASLGRMFDGIGGLSAGVSWL